MGQNNIQHMILQIHNKYNKGGAKITLKRGELQQNWSLEISNSSSRLHRRQQRYYRWCDVLDIWVRGTQGWQLNVRSASTVRPSIWNSQSREWRRPLGQTGGQMQCFSTFSGRKEGDGHRTRHTNNLQSVCLPCNSVLSVWRTHICWRE